MYSQVGYFVCLINNGTGNETRLIVKETEEEVGKKQRQSKRSLCRIESKQNNEELASRIAVDNGLAIVTSLFKLETIDKLFQSKIN